MQKQKCHLTKQVAVETRKFDINAEDPAMMEDPPEVVNYELEIYNRLGQGANPEQSQPDQSVVNS